MIKNILTLLAAFIMSQGVFAQSQGYTVTGIVEGCEEGDTVYLCNMEGFFSMVPVDSAYIKGGKFTFKGNYDGAVMRFLCPLHKGQSLQMATIVLENADFDVKITAEGSEVKGGTTGALYDEYEKGVEATYGGESMALFGIVGDSTLTETERNAAKAKLDAINKRVADYKYNYVMSHIPSPVSDMIFPSLADEVSDEQFEAIIKKMEASGTLYANYKAVMAERAAQKATAIGEMYTDLALNSPDGKTVRVSDYVSSNKYTMIDFWASWCGPCLKEMPWVVKAYEAHHAQGFEIIGISLDNNKESWLKAIAKYNMPWPHMSDLKGWNCEAAKPYNVKAIPANVLIDQNGHIVAKNLREQELLDTLDSLFK